MSDHESYLFHGTSEEKMQAIAKEGFKPELSHEASRYGRGTYFADTSCKIHQYTGGTPGPPSGALSPVSPRGDVPATTAAQNTHRRLIPS